VFLPTLSAQLQPIHNPYASFYTTFAVPLQLQSDPKKARSAELAVMGGIQKWVPKSLRGQSDILDQVVGGYASHTRGEQSKVAVQSSKGKVVLGIRGTRDEEQARSMGLAVGAKDGNKKKKWWRS